MKAAVLTKYGAAPEQAERPDPVAGPDQEPIRVTAAPIVPLDLLCATGTSYFGQPPLPYMPGVQGVGVAGDGRRVFFSTSAGMKPGDGSLAEHGRFVHLGGSGGPTTTFSGAALRSGSHSILGYPNNALTAARKAEALGAVLAHRFTVTYETVGLDEVADAWSRAGTAPDGRLVVVP